LPELDGNLLQKRPSTLDTLVFSGNKAIVYYLPGTTGWGTTWAVFQRNCGFPDSNRGSQFGVQSNQFGFYITGTNDFTLVVEACTNLANPFGLRSRPTRSSMVRSISAILSGRIIPGDTTLLVSPDSQVMGEPLKQIENSIPRRSWKEKLCASPGLRQDRSG